MEREQGSEGWDSTPARRITPEEVQSKEFRSARVRVGYVMHEVDEFLDHVTDTLTALIAENERLRAERTGAPAGSVPPPAAAAPTGAADRAAVDAFLQREKAFLQDLGALVQTHAEQLKSMVRSARSAAATPNEPGAAAVERPQEQEEPALASAASAPAVAPAVVGEAEPEASSEPEPASREEPEPASQAPEAEAAAAEGEDVDAILDGSDDTGALTPVEAEEPIRLDEPEPARSRRSDEGGETTLRDLFWGEE